MTGHTPGPWQIRRSRSGYPYQIHAPNGSDEPSGIKDVTRWNSICVPSLPEGEANAQLIAAAPDLLEALKQAVEWNGYDDKGEEAVWLTLAEEALAKAEKTTP